MDKKRLTLGSELEVAARVMADMAAGHHDRHWEPEFGAICPGPRDMMKLAEEQVGKRIVFIPHEEAYFVYDNPTGMWVQLANDAIVRHIAYYDGTAYGTIGKDGQFPQLRITKARNAGALNYVKAFSSRRDFFKDAIPSYSLGRVTALPGYTLDDPPEDYDPESPFFTSDPVFRARCGITEYDPNTDPTEILEALERVFMPPNQDAVECGIAINIFLEWLGNAISGRARLVKRGLILLGTEGGNNGKMFIGNLCRSLLPQERVYSRTNDLNFDKEWQKARLANTRLGIFSEIDAKAIDLKRLNGLVVGDPDEARVLGHMGFTFYPNLGILWDCNKLPEFRAGAQISGLARRWVILKTQNNLGASGMTEEEVQALIRRSRRALAGEALKRAHTAALRKSLTTPSVSMEMTLRDWLMTAEPLKLWAQECLVEERGAFLKSNKAWQAFQDWCDSSRQTNTYTAQKFWKDIRSILPKGGFYSRSGGRSGYRNVKIQSSEDMQELCRISAGIPIDK